MKTEIVTSLIDEAIDNACDDEMLKGIIYDVCDVEKAYWGRKRDYPEKLKRIDQIFSTTLSDGKKRGML